MTYRLAIKVVKGPNCPPTASKPGSYQPTMVLSSVCNNPHLELSNKYKISVKKKKKKSL